jgi:DNA excision repair protein ERCC-5
MVYLEDIDPMMPTSPSKNAQPKPVEEATPPSAKKSRWQDHDPYRLPTLDMDAIIAKATSSAAPDPRLATEEELQAFIDEMRPEDLDVTSPDFRDLPTEVQYEIIGDLRLKSRQTSYKRLQSMLRNSHTSMDFSREQIKNLKQRNSLTQQLLVTTDSVGKANITIPVRIAAERNREYVLIKNDADKGGGWILGRRDEGTIDKPILIDVPTTDEQTQVSHVDEDDDSDMDMEQVNMYVHVCMLQEIISHVCRIRPLKTRASANGFRPTRYATRTRVDRDCTSRYIEETRTTYHQIETT